MAKIYEPVGNLLRDVEKFLVETLKNENLSSSTNKSRNLLLEKLNNLKQEYPQLQIDVVPPVGTSPKSVPKSSSSVGLSEDSRDESSFTGGSTNTEEDEVGYSDSIPFIAATDIVNPTKTGVLEKKRRKENVLLFKSYQKRWCVLKDNILYYYDKQSDKRQLGAFILKDYEVRTNPNVVKEASKKELSFELVSPGKRSYLFVAPSKEELADWKSSIENAALNMMTSSMMDDQDGESIYEEFDEIMPINGRPSIAEEVYDDNLNCLPDDSELTPIKKAELPPIPGSPKHLLLKSNMSPPPPALPERNPPTVRPTEPAASDDGLIGEVYDDIGTDVQKFLRNTKVEIKPDDYENIYYSLWDCVADDSTELAFKEGDLIRILNKEYDKQSWWIGMLDGQIGLVPKTFLTNAYELVA
ncbi:kinase-associated phosphoprotein 2-B-like isoform X2 [Octopus vulgaris]|uniref:Kinase-associated phosphoprotein 2-B-like isoform X2 n=2 Tax=Octopus TaxID=6643 RepID=A0AA36AT37_OCTVU|nr:src kinase-associated phosphoprotein 2 [Octopus sinensis]CAI9721214.1 kinase-associated phosphoprotein 2-B-like isoform X2 [Octopus vulgaris]